VNRKTLPDPDSSFWSFRSTHSWSRECKRPRRLRIRTQQYTGTWPRRRLRASLRAWSSCWRVQAAQCKCCRSLRKNEVL